MNRTLMSLLATAIAMVASAQSSLAFAPETTAASQAMDWLHQQQTADGTIAGNATRTEETVIGLVANGKEPASLSSNGKNPIDSLRLHIADEEQTPGNIAYLIMAVAAAGLDPASFAGRNLLQDLACTYDPQTGVFSSQLFNDALAVLALPQGGAPAKATNYLVSHQQADGGWEFQSGYGSDTNTTAIVLMALAAAGDLPSTTSDRALAYFKAHQKPSGGFEYAAPYTPPGDSDPNSDALVIEALLALHQDPTSTSWAVGDHNALTDLLTFQYANGGFGYSRPTSPGGAPDAASTTQALPALASAFLPVRRTMGSMPSACSAATATASATVRPSASTVPTTTRTLAQTGGGAPLPGALLVFAGVAILVAGRRRRQAG